MKANEERKETKVLIGSSKSARVRTHTHVTAHMHFILK